ncbi:Lrp/AsnC family transcriptional regulator [Nocardia arthritidis]|uniref:AsnC family transcriptional regulator n=1 Tax=Nocardia arthritidis TaxID=228602 RepID=A0A6G9YLV2_9NOCA|nr:Lrp/AsnC family transcriptional regulator [Nocardia arthritidis]QIS14006.1 AsnC family transcriptional regulator [Nocardia arthritidis]
MPLELEETDRRIAVALLSDPRASWRELAQRLNLSERTVVRRAIPLYEKGVLRASAMRNLSVFPQMVPITLRLRCTRERIGTICDALASRPDTIGMDVLSGGSEISALVFLDGPQERDALLLRDLPATPAVLSWTAERVLRVFPASDPAHRPAPDELILGVGMLESERPPKLLEVDKALIQALIRNGRASYTELGAAAGITAHTARRRLEILFREHVVRPVTVVDVALLGLKSQALLWLTVQPGALEEIGRRLALHPMVFYAGAVSGPTNLHLAVAARDDNEIYQFVTGTVGAIPEVTMVETSAILATIKRSGLRFRPPWPQSRGGSGQASAVSAQ